MQFHLRQDLELSPQIQQGKSFLVVKDPVTRRYFRFTESQAAILEELAEPVDAATLGERVSERLGQPVSTPTMEAFLASLESKSLLESPEVRDKLSSIQGRQIQGRNYFYWKLASIDPERIFNWLLPRTEWAFTPAFQVLAVVSILTGFTISALNWAQFAGAAAPLLSLYGLLLIYPVVFVVVTIHEFSHGLTCRHFGGKVHEVGFMLIYFQPAFYCDVSDSWMFPRKRDRMLVTLAGSYVQLTVWGVCAMIWRITDPDTVINHITLIVVVFSGLQTLLNLNPLIKLDGYYMLSDYLEIPNLRSRALRGFWDWVAGRSKTGRPQGVQFIYGAAAAVFSTTLLLVVYSTLYTLATRHYALAGLVGFLMFATFTLRKTATESLAGVRAVAERSSIRKFRNLGILAAALLMSFVAHWELKVSADFKVLARNEAVVRAQTEGVVTEMLVHEGSAVHKGDVLARMGDFEKQQQAGTVFGELKQKQSELALLVAGASKEEINRKQTLVDTKRVELANARRTQEQRNQLQQTLERKKSELELDQQTQKRSQQLFQGGLIPRADVEKADTAVKVREREIGETEASIRVITETGDREADLKARELAEAESELRLMMAGNRPERIHEVQAEVSRLEVELRLLNQELEKTAVRAPIDGVVTTPFVERKVNQHFDPGEELCTIVDTQRVTAEMSVPEKELADVRAGNPVWLKIRSFPESDFEGKVDFIAPVAQTVNGQQMVTVRADLANEDQRLKPEMTGVAKIYCGERKVIDLVTRRLRRWVRTEFWDLMP